MSLWNTFTRYLYRELIQPILHSKDEPQLLARGAALGIFIAMTPTVGIQMGLVLACALIPRLHFNIPVALAMVWISNPVTVLPLYYFFYRFGLLFLQKNADSWPAFIEKIQKILENLEQYSYFQKMYRGAIDFFSLGVDYAIPLWIGGIFTGILCALGIYPFTLWLLKGHTPLSPPQIEKEENSQDAP